MWGKSLQLFDMFVSQFLIVKPSTATTRDCMSRSVKQHAAMSLFCCGPIMWCHRPYVRCLKSLFDSVHDYNSIYKQGSIIEMEMNSLNIRRRKKNTLFYRQTDLPSRVGWSRSKIDPINTKFWKKSEIICRTILRKYLTYFQKFSAKIYRFWSRNGWFDNILEKLKKKKNLPKRTIWVGRACKTVLFCFFVALSYNMYHDIYNMLVSCGLVINISLHKLAENCLHYVHNTFIFGKCTKYD